MEQVTTGKHCDTQPIKRAAQGGLQESDWERLVRVIIFDLLTDAQPGANVVREPLGAPLRTANNTKQTQSRKRSHTAEITKRVSWVFLFLLHPISVKISD